MDKLLIRGGRQLHGEVLISGAKNATLPELCACEWQDSPNALGLVGLRIRVMAADWA